MTNTTPPATLDLHRRLRAARAVCAAAMGMPVEHMPLASITNVNTEVSPTPRNSQVWMSGAVIARVMHDDPEDSTDPRGGARPRVVAVIDL